MTNNHQADDFDSILQEVGSFGKYQKINFCLLSAIIGFTAMQYAFIFTTRSAKYRCYIPECDDAPEESFYNVPWWPNEMQTQCQRYSFIEKFNRTQVCNEASFNRNVHENCDKFVFESGDATIQKEFNLTCEENLKKLTFVGSLGEFCEILGGPLVGYISDRYGRRHVMIIGAVLASVIGAGKSLLTNYEHYVILEGLERLVASGIFSAGYVLAIELVTAKHRILYSTLLMNSFSLGEVYLCLIAWLTDSWRLLLRIIHLPGLLFVFYYYFFSESIRWLLVKNKIHEAKQILIKVAKYNGVALRTSDVNKMNFNAYKMENASGESIWRVFFSLTLTIRFLFCAFVWLSCTFIYYGFNMKSITISGNMYANYLLAVMMEIPGDLICYWLLNEKRRKPVLCFSLFITGMICVLLLVLPLGNLEIILFALGKLCITVSQSTIYVYTAEVFPTTIRHSIFAGCSMFGRLGAMAAPQIPLLSTVSPFLVYTLFSAMAILSSVLVSTFPESLNTELPDTVKEAVTIGR